MTIRNRIKELRRVPARDLRPHPRNWREHPEGQREALSAILAEIGYADALLAYEEGGILTIFDGHLRRDISADEEVPVLVTDLTPEEARTMLTVLDPLAAMAEANQEALDELVAEIDTQNEALKEMLDGLGIDAGDNGKVELKQLDTRKPPAMSWVLVGIPTVRFGEIAEAVDDLSAVDGIILETTVSNG